MIKSKYSVGVDVGGSHICSAVVDLSTGKIEGKPVSSPIDSGADATEIIAILNDNIVAAVRDSGVSGVEGVGMAFPGPFDYVHGISLIEGVGKYDNLFGLDVGASMQAALCGHGISSVRFTNDASAFALGESFAGAAKGFRRTVAITLGTGVGSGFVADGKIVDSGDEVPAFGWVYHLPFEEGIADDAFSTRWICRRYKELTGETVSGARQVVESRDRRGREVGQLFNEFGSRFARFIVPVLKRFRADALVLGGNISRAYPYFGSSLEAGLADECSHVAVRTSALLDEAAMVGAAMLFK